MVSWTPLCFVQCHRLRYNEERNGSGWSTGSAALLPDDNWSLHAVRQEQTAVGWY
jgi:hypothetical protein